MYKSTQSVTEFCNDNNISKAHFYNLLRKGQGPVILKAGKRSLISVESAAAWRKKLETSMGGGQ
jgi:hypothetical protein